MVASANIPMKWKRAQVTSVGRVGETKLSLIIQCWPGAICILVVSSVEIGTSHECKTCANTIFLTMSTSLKLRRWADHIDNLEVMPRIFKELGLFTRNSRFKWDANTKRDDGMQYGWHRIPSKSHFLRFCAYLVVFK